MKDSVKHFDTRIRLTNLLPNCQLFVVYN